MASGSYNVRTYRTYQHVEQGEDRAVDIDEADQGYDEKEGYDNGEKWERRSNASAAQTDYINPVAYSADFWSTDAGLRYGSWSVIFGFVSMVIGLVLISVFWRWWYGPGINIPLRIVGVTFMSHGVCMVLFGLICNFFMVRNKRSKFILGSPKRFATLLILFGFFCIIVAADCISIYYLYWRNRFVNTPLIITAIILFFFGPIFIGIGIKRNHTIYLTKIGKKKKKNYRRNATQAEIF